MASSYFDGAYEALGIEEGFTEGGSNEQRGSFACEGERLNALNVALTRRHDYVMDRLSSRSDGEARRVLTSLNEDLTKQNGALTAFMAQLASQNRSLREMLEESKDGQAAISMRDAAEVLVKGIANAEQEVRGLRAKLKKVTTQRDRYRNRLAKTNAELTSSDAHARIARMVPGQEGSRPAAAATPTRGRDQVSAPSMNSTEKSNILRASVIPDVQVLDRAGGDEPSHAGGVSKGYSLGWVKAGATGHVPGETGGQVREGSREEKGGRGEAAGDNGLEGAAGSETQSAYDSEEAPSMFF